MKILFVDDDKLMLKLYRTFLKDEAETEISCFENVDEAFKTAKRHYFDIIFSDIKMPGQDGIEFLNKILTSQIKYGKFFFVSADREFTTSDATENGADGIIYKPLQKKRTAISNF